MPNRARVSATASGLAFTPSATCAGSPGNTAMNANTAIDASTMLTANSRVRRATYSSIGHRPMREVGCS